MLMIALSIKGAKMNIATELSCYQNIEEYRAYSIEFSVF